MSYPYPVFRQSESFIEQRLSLIYFAVVIDVLSMPGIENLGFIEFRDNTLKVSIKI